MLLSISFITINSSLCQFVPGNGLSNEKEQINRSFFDPVILHTKWDKLFMQ
jgi:hypothetical protein